MGPSDWRRLLADPRKQWRATKSAYEAPVAWESARNGVRGLPSEIAAHLDSDAAFRGAHLLLALPEHQVALEGGGHASQTDLWALLSAPIGVVSTAIEAKAGEPFDRTVREWLSDASKRAASRIDSSSSVSSCDLPKPVTSHQLDPLILTSLIHPH